MGSEGQGMEESGNVPAVVQVPIPRGIHERIHMVIYIGTDRRRDRENEHNWVETPRKTAAIRSEVIEMIEYGSKVKWTEDDILYWGGERMEAKTPVDKTKKIDGASDIDGDNRELAAKCEEVLETVEGDSIRRIWLRKAGPSDFREPGVLSDDDNGF